jgi:phosphoribosylamine--glycine ligase
MKILVLGSGGREHALVWKIAQSPRVEKVFCAPGNPGVAALADCVPISVNDTGGLLALAQREQIDLTVVGPEQPLANGLCDLFSAHGLKAFGPSQRASELEWSKKFAKEFMLRHGVPTGSFRTFEAGEETHARVYLRSLSLPIVVKADGLAAGKGVVICSTLEEAQAVLDKMWGEKVFGKAGEHIIIEEYLQGEEASVFAVCDGESYALLAPAQDHKRVFDGDKGKNTGGMGAYAPAACVTGQLLETIQRRILVPTLKGMAQEGRPYVGCLYLGLIITKEGPKVIEFNSRFGDPEAQVILPLYGGDIVDLLESATDGRIGALTHEQRRAPQTGSAVCVVLASGGYPDSYRTGYPVYGLEAIARERNVVAFHAGTRLEDGNVVTAGGRVLGITAVLPHGELQEAIAAAYSALQKISFEHMHYRRDIGVKGVTFKSGVTALST